MDTIGKNKEKIRDYIKKQLEEDKLGTQLCLPYPGSPFTGRKQQKCRCQIRYAPVRALLVTEPYRRI